MKGKKTGLKRGLAVILASLFVLSMIVTSIARTWTGKINAFFGTTSYKTEKTGESAGDGIYYKSEFTTVKDVIDAKADEPVAVSLERAGIPIDAHCRGGECGYCRAQLLGGNIFVSPLGDGRRRMDKEMGWFHSCSAFPMSDLTIKIPIL